MTEKVINDILNVLVAHNDELDAALGAHQALHDLVMTQAETITELVHRVKALEEAMKRLDPTYGQIRAGL